MSRRIFISAIIFFIAVIDVYADEYQAVRGVVDLHSNISDGLYSPERIAELAKEDGIRILIFSDSALRKWEYGIWPLKNFLKRAVEENSVLRLGAGEYLKSISELNGKFPDLLIMPGLEVNPFYYWKGGPFSRNFSLNDYYKRFLVFGLNKDDFQNMPIAGNHSLKFNQYQGRQGIKPYQELIDYVNRKGGLVFWSHPEMESIQKYKEIEVYTPEHPRDLFLSSDYTGFGVTFTDRLEMLAPGGVWDKLLLEYISAARKKPVWIIGALHYDGFTRKINEVETMFFMKEITQRDVFDALREGRMYVRFNSGNQPLILREFSVKKLDYDTVGITIKGDKPFSSAAVKIELIRNGQLLKSFQEDNDEWEISVEDKLSAAERKIYYRLKISNSSSLIFSNPVFVGH